MRAEDTLQYMTDFYSNLFPTRKHALNFLFNVVGNGYEWIKGELVNKDDEFEKRYKLREHVDKAIFRNEEDWLSTEAMWKRLEAAGFQNAPPLTIFKWTSPREFTALYSVPSDITNDWKALVQECIELMKSDGIIVENVLNSSSNE